MIEIVSNALDLGNQCRIVSCQFDVEHCRATTLDELQQTWGVKVPAKLHKAVDKRKAEFIAGRYCARKAMLQLDDVVSVSDSPSIDIGEKREPLWPEGIIGSITHSHGYAAAVAGSKAHFRGIGIDSEHSIGEKTANNVSSQILTDEENYQHNTDIVNSAVDYLTLVFSAKESIFKSLYPLVLQYFDFRDAVIHLSADNKNQFEFRLLKNLNDEFCAGYHGSGIYCFNGNFVHTAVTVPV